MSNGSSPKTRHVELFVTQCRTFRHPKPSLRLLWATRSSTYLADVVLAVTATSLPNIPCLYHTKHVHIAYISHACHMHILISIYIYIYIYIYHISYHIRRPRGTETQRQNMYTHHAYIMRVCTHMDMSPDMTHATQRRQDKPLRLYPRNQVKNGLISNAKVFATGNASLLSCVARALVSVVDAHASPSSAPVPYACTGGSNGARR